MRAPRLTIGLPVYNGERYLAAALDALLGQSFEDFELILSDNASTDGTPDICNHYQQLDPRVRIVRHPNNIGSSPSHNFVVDQARGELFKWASDDDLYARDLLSCCIEALDGNPHVVLAHSWTAMIDASGSVTKAIEYSLTTSSTRAPERFRSLLFDEGGDDIYGVIRRDVLKRVVPQDSYHHADRTIVAKLGLQGPFLQVPAWLYFRRDHPKRAERACSTMRSRCANMDPRRADRLRHPAVRLYGEYVWAYVAAIRDASLSSADRRECYQSLFQWAASRAHPGRSRRVDSPPGPVAASLPTGAMVPGWQELAS
jgi:glycosyltransferase involved in cell wall biosynthesis